jgi:hypothetical protein
LTLGAGRARLRPPERRAPAESATLQALEAMSAAVAATRAYVYDESHAFDGSRESARWFALTRRWKQAAEQVLALDLAGAERTRARAEGWLAVRPWRRLQKEDGGWRLETILEHCAALLKGLDEAR